MAHSDSDRQLVSDIKNEFLECKICLLQFKDPRTLPCHHVTCTPCLETILKENDPFPFPCPYCKQEVQIPADGIEAFPKAFWLNALADMVHINNRSVSCYNKEGGSPHDEATIMCIECNVFYCSDCNTDHKKAAFAKHHGAVPLTNVTNENFERAAKNHTTFCSEHDKSPLVNFCMEESCRIPVCQICSTVNHKGHESVKLSYFAKSCRADFTKKVTKDFKTAENKLNDTKQECIAAVQGKKRQLEQSIVNVKKRANDLVLQIRNQEQAMIQTVEKYTDEIIKKYHNKEKDVTIKLKTIDSSKSVLESVAHFLPDNKIVTQQDEGEMTFKATMNQVTPPEVWHQSVAVTLLGSPLVDMKLEVYKSKQCKSMQYWNKSVSSMVILEELSVVLSYNPPTASGSSLFCVKGENEERANDLQGRLEKYCPNAVRIITMKKDGEEFIVICEKIGSPIPYIKIVSVDKDKCDPIQMPEYIQPLTIGLDSQNNITFVDNRIPKAIRKWKCQENEIQTVFENSQGNEVLASPWYMCTNINEVTVVADVAKKSLTFFDKNGHVINIYNNFTPGKLLFPSGVCTGPNGDVYACDVNGHKIHHYDKAGKFLGFVITEHDDLLNPSTVQYHHEMLVIGQLDGKVKYFKL